MAWGLTNKVKVNIVIEQNILKTNIQLKPGLFLLGLMENQLEKAYGRLVLYDNCLKTIIWKMLKCPLWKRIKFAKMASWPVQSGKREQVFLLQTGNLLCIFCLKKGGGNELTIYGFTDEHGWIWEEVNYDVTSVKEERE